MGLNQKFLIGLIVLQAGLSVAATDSSLKPSAEPSVLTGKALLSESEVNTGSCSQIRRLALEISAHTSNIANVNTTRTPDGGGYKRLEVTCKIDGKFCDLLSKSEFKEVNLPTHPDADTKGIVKYPAISLASEWAGLNLATGELRQLAKRKSCGVTLTESEGSALPGLGTMMTVKYFSDFDVVSDTFLFKTDGKLDSWKRVLKEGPIQAVSFRDDGKTVGSQ